VILKTLKMENIRSYTSPKELDLPTGSVLLTGDIGSGKSTVLHAVDFALFGIQTDLGGGALLRKGENHGQVELCFALDGRECRVLRKLERKRGAVADVGGFIEVDGKRKNKKAVELKAAVLELLGYPIELAEKRRNLVYKYTVYTPQEEMKQILTGDASARLETLRRTFGIESYRRMQENARKLTTLMNAEIRAKKLQFADLEARKREMEEIREKGEGLKEDLKGALAAAKKIEETLGEKKEELKAIEGEIKAMHEAEKDLRGKDSERKALLRALESSKREIEEMEEAKKGISSSLRTFSALASPGRSEGELKKRLEGLRSAQERKTRELSALEERIASLQKILEEGRCGTCEQAVADPSLFEEKIEGRKAKARERAGELKRIKEEIDEAEEELDCLREHEKKQKERKVLKDRLGEVGKALKVKLAERKGREKEVKALSSEIARLENKVKGFAKLEERHARLKEEEERLLRQKSGVERRGASLEKEVEYLGREAERLKAEIERREDAKRQHVYLREVSTWLGKLFSNLVASIEKQVMTSILAEFSALFQEWFRVLIEDEALTVRLDGDFSPVIMQNGYDTDYGSLSGGEKTSIALAYRLSLNKVINMLVEELKTKDLLILDEPTDGFSREQLDRVRDVLERLNTKQTIIVSHEPEIEGFVESTIRFYKENHVSNFSYSGF